ncbi:monofunctional biosynthetic peptidoglycan transglycosylase [Lottiidibacillus patelloidae]|uniref:Monofunctional biosynthetic peptidoglycan transglycosylase n=1 Tax=Lottiidibacillus patelloidae TaxID=2670334 RepID=A0A263BSN9_9BACI|nr:PBP1A family penicillin-binding protein [Lottiidibacillus patelloidae]OZM56733.1 monofunctional biosynthetic peptidoglycan transglycosylase [Lottiidibacillus patelloidae]
MNMNRKVRKVFKVLFALASTFTFLIILSIIGLLLYVKALGPPPLVVSQSSIFYASDGTIIGETNNGQKRYWVPLEQISEHLIHATISIEDRKFFDHDGFDYKRIVGAAIADLKSMAKVQGASTITQQYARNLFLEHDKTWKRKLHEALYTLRLEAHYDKQQILEGYLNTIYYGHGMYGIEAAANYYFDKPAMELTLSEATILAGIPKGPTYYSPKLHEKNAKARQKTILKAMVKQDKLTAEEAKLALDEPLQFVYKSKTEKIDRLAPYFQDIVKNELLNKLGISERLINNGGLKVYTTLHPLVQKTAEKAIDVEMYHDSTIQSALVAIDPKSGAVIAMIGGNSYEQSPFNRAVQAKRQPGSTFKPLVYYTALENGFTASTQLLSQPTSFTFDEGREVYAPANYNNYYQNGPITLAQAIALSDNIYAVKTNLFLGIDKVVENIKKFGIKSHIASVPSLPLGTSLMSVSEMTNAYAIIANGGKKIEPHVIEKVIDQQGNIVFERDYEKEQVLDPTTTFLLSNLMEGMFDERLNGVEMRVTGSSINNLISRRVAGKSGSTPTDSWMIGFTPQLAVGVWIGYDDNRKIEKVKELIYAKRIWARVMEETLKNKRSESLKTPDDVIAVLVNPQNGKRATEACPIQKMTYYVKGTEPVEFCTEHIKDPRKTKERKNQTEKEDEDDGWFQGIIDRLF